jgi:hypothetical protein
MLTLNKGVPAELVRIGAAIAIAFILFAPALPAQQPAAPSAAEPELIHAVRSGDSPRWHALLRSGADVSALDGHGDTALLVAAYRGDAPAVEALLERGAKPDALNADGATALLYGAGSDEVVKALLSHGANPNIASKLGFTPLMAAAAHHDSRVTVARLLNAGADVHVKLKGQEIMALKAVYGGDPATLAMLLDHGASPQQTKGDESSPWQWPRTSTTGRRWRSFSSTAPTSISTRTSPATPSTGRSTRGTLPWRRN